MREQYIEVALDRPIDTVFTYRIPEELSQYASIGIRVNVPFGKADKYEMGYVINVTSEKPPFTTKDIIGIVDTTPIFSNYEIELARWIANYYICSIGEALATIIPKEDKEKKTDFSKGIERKSLLTLNDEQEYVFN